MELPDNINFSMTEHSNSLRNDSMEDDVRRLFEKSTVFKTIDDVFDNMSQNSQKLLSFSLHAITLMFFSELDLPIKFSAISSKPSF